MFITPYCCKWVIVLAGRIAVSKSGGIVVSFGMWMSRTTPLWLNVMFMPLESIMLYVCLIKYSVHFAIVAWEKYFAMKLLAAEGMLSSVCDALITMPGPPHICGVECLSELLSCAVVGMAINVMMPNNSVLFMSFCIIMVRFV